MVCKRPFGPVAGGATMSYPMPHLAAVPTMYRPPVSDAHVAIAWVVTALTAGYMLPWAIAATTRKSNTASIALIDLLLGWTFVGWVAALVMACLPEPVAVAPVL